jgi:hypothetical protein
VTERHAHLKLSDFINRWLNSTADYASLLDLLAQVIESNKGPIRNAADDRFYYAEGLALKFFHHAASALYLSRCRRLPDLPSMSLRFLDSPSVDVLARSAYETYLIFHYVFSGAKDDDEKDLRYWTWKAAGLAERQNYPLPHEAQEQIEQKLEKEKADLDELRRRIVANPSFQSLPKPKRNKVLTYLSSGKGDWKLQNWREIAESAGLNKMISSYFYQYLCGYAHSGFVSVMQTKQRLQEPEDAPSMQASLHFVTVATANLIHEYCELFPRAKTALDRDPIGSGILRRWIQIGQMSFGA